MHAQRLAVALVAGWLAFGCAAPSSQRGDVEFGRLTLLTRVEFPPQLAEAPSVQYPEVLAAQGVEGTAEIVYTVDDTGGAVDVTIKSASDPAFGAAAERAIRRTRFVPARRGLMNVRCTVQQTMFFRIR